MEENMDKEITLLTRMYQDASIGMQSIDKVIKKLQKDEIKNLLKQQFEAYQKIADRCDIVALSRGTEVKENGMYSKLVEMLETNLRYVEKEAEIFKL